MCRCRPRTSAGTCDHKHNRSRDILERCLHVGLVICLLEVVDRAAVALCDHVVAVAEHRVRPAARRGTWHAFLNDVSSRQVTGVLRHLALADDRVGARNGGRARIADSRDPLR